MPLRNVADAMHEAGRKGWSRKQAIAIGLKAEGKSRSSKRKSSRDSRRRPAYR